MDKILHVLVGKDDSGPKKFAQLQLLPLEVGFGDDSQSALIGVGQHIANGLIKLGLDRVLASGFL
jgi:hypothetical protein